ncbi:MAG TPA: hypothetical protein VFF73_39560 [Planctomycetota bacterium]|nr:hypothetical protein [Planctomycetota bacterium]
MIRNFAIGCVAFAMLGFSPAFAQNNGGDQQGGGGNGQQQGGGGNGQQQGGGGNGGGGQQPGPGGNGGGGNRQRGNRGGQRQAMADALKDVLSLTDDEITKIKALDATAQEDMTKLRDEMRNQGGGGGNGGQNFQAMRDKMQEIVTKERTAVREILTTDQQAKFDDWVKQQDAQRQQRGRRGQNGQNGQGGQNGMNGRGRGGDPAQRTQRLLDEAEKALTLSPDEKSVVMPLIKALLEAKAALREAETKRRDELTTFMKDKKADTDKDEIASKLKEFRKANDSDREKVKSAQAALCEVLTVDNETKLASLGIID